MGCGSLCRVSMHALFLTFGCWGRARRGTARDGGGGHKGRHGTSRCPCALVGGPGNGGV